MSRAFGHESSSPPVAPQAAGPGTPLVDRDGASVAFRLAIGRDGLGLELERTAFLACLDVTELVVRLPRVRFPFDVTGGVAKFRHKRGELERLTLDIDVRKVEAWTAERLRGLITTGACKVTILPRRMGATCTLHGPVAAAADAPDTQLSVGIAALAFELDIVPARDELSIVVHGARGAHLPDAPTTLALRAVSAALGDMARREGARFVIERPAARLARRLLPEAGVRAPSGDDVVLMGSGCAEGAWVFVFSRGAVPVEATHEATRAAEAALILRTADDTRLGADADRARSRDVEALERAPKHPEIVRRIVEADALVRGRAEAALATLRELEPSGVTWMGLTAGVLHLEAHDIPSANAAFVREGDREPSTVLSALAYAAAAQTTTDRGDALVFFDRAVSRAPLLAELRWRRARLRLLEGRLSDARADMQELEALARGPRERLATVRRGAELYREVGLGQAAATLYERALLYAPEDPEALFGLGACLAMEGRPARGATLVARAIDLGERQRIVTSSMALTLARILSEQLDDRPAAIARLKGIADGDPAAIEARGLEGRLRASLGDRAGASLSFARLRAQSVGVSSAVSWLVEAAAFEQDRFELLAAQRHAEAALAIEPRNDKLLALYRDLGRRIADDAGATVKAAPAPEMPARPEIPSREQAPSFPGLHEHAHAPGPALDEAEAEARVEVLVRAVQADPSNEAAVDELATLLSKLGRSMELFALLSARLEEAPAERRQALLPKHREVLEILERLAREEGRPDEAELFKMAREAT